MILLNQLPCPVLITDGTGRVLASNSELLALLGGTEQEWLQKPMEVLLPPASRVFLQTHIWPMLLRQERVCELYLYLRDARGQRIPVMLNCQQGSFEDAEAYYWVFFVAQERSLFEAELLKARNRAEASATALSKSEHFIKTIANAMPGMVAYWDKDLICHFANQFHMDWFGKSPEVIIGSTLQDLLGERMFAENERYVRGVLAGDIQTFEWTQYKTDGSIGYTLANFIPDMDAQGAIAGFFVLVSDVTPLKVAEAELKLAASVLENIIEGVMIADSNGTILSVNTAFTEITGFTHEEAIGQTPRLLRSNHHDQEFYAALWRDITTQGQWRGEIWNRRKDGDAFLMWQTITRIPGKSGEPGRYVSVFHDITDLWHRNENIRHLAFHDALTDLPNRALLMERLERQIAAMEREPRALALMFLDLDRFKHVNDTFGHDVGDELLMAVAQNLLAMVRQSDTVARLGGDEFVIMLDNPANQEEVAHIAERIITVINEPVQIRGQVAHVGTSIGIALYPTGGDSAAELIKRADLAMYASKGAGRNTYRFFTPAMAASIDAQDQGQSMAAIGRGPAILKSLV